MYSDIFQKYHVIYSTKSFNFNRRQCYLFFHATMTTWTQMTHCFIQHTKAIRNILRCYIVLIPVISQIFFSCTTKLKSARYYHSFQHPRTTQYFLLILYSHDLTPSLLNPPFNTIYTLTHLQKKLVTTLLWTTFFWHLQRS